MTSAPPTSAPPTSARRRVVVTGGSGFIGRHLVDELTRDGSYEVVVLSRSPERVTGLPVGARAEGWNPAGPDGWSRWVDGAFGVVHLAGHNVFAGRWTDETKRRIRDSRVGSSRAVRAAIESAEVKPQVLVQGSAVGFYGSVGDEILTEDHPPGNDFLANVCGEWEQASAGVEALGVRRPVVRTGVVLASDDGALPRMILPFKLGLGGPLGSGKQYVPWIHVSDEVRAIRFLMESPDATGAYNLTSPHPVRQRELARALGRVLHRPSLLPVPRVGLHLAVGEMAAVVLASQRANPQRLREAGFEFRFPQLEPALEDLVHA